MTNEAWEPSTNVHRRGWLGIVITLALCLLAFIWVGSTPDPRLALPWQWNAEGWVLPARSLAGVWLLAALLFAILSRIAFRLHTEWPPPLRSVHWIHALPLLLVTIALYTTIALLWTPLPLDPTLLVAKTLSPGTIARLPGILAGVLTIAVLCAWLIQQNRSIWWAALVALHPLMLWQCAANGTHFAIAALLVALLAAASNRLPASAQSLMIVLAAFVAIIAVALPYHADPFDSPIALLPHTVSIGTRSAIGGSLQLLVLGFLILQPRSRRWPFPKTLGYQLLLAILLLPTIPPALVLLPLVLIPFAWNRTTWVLSLAILLAYTAIPTLRATGHFHVPFILATLQWIPILVLLAHDLLAEAITAVRQQPPLASAAAAALP